MTNWRRLKANSPPCTECEAGRIPQTGQTASYAEEDDGNLKRGVDWPNPRFDNQRMIVTDKLTGLSWTKDANVFVPLSWNNALEACANCSEGNYADWRLPNLRELQSLIDYGQHGPALPHNHFFSNVQSNFYWSSTTSDAEIDLAWRVDLNDGSIKDGHKFYENYVWCVRGGL